MIMIRLFSHWWPSMVAIITRLYIHMCSPSVCGWIATERIRNHSESESQQHSEYSVSITFSINNCNDWYNEIKFSRLTSFIAGKSRLNFPNTKVIGTYSGSIARITFSPSVSLTVMILTFNTSTQCALYFDCGFCFSHIRNTEHNTIHNMNNMAHTQYNIVHTHTHWYARNCVSRAR